MIYGLGNIWVPHTVTRAPPYINESVDYVRPPPSRRSITVGEGVTFEHKSFRTNGTLQFVEE